MPRRPPGNGRHGGGGAQRKRLVVAYAALFLASCANLVDAATQHNPHHQTRGAEPLAHINRQVAADDLNDAARGWAGAHTAVQPGSVKSHPNNRYKDSAESSSSSSSAATPENADDDDDDDDDSRGQYTAYNDNNNIYENIVIPNDASALATLAPAQPVRAPPAGLRPSAPSAPGATGLASPPSARSLADWEVEDFVLLATVDGDLYASDRKTGQRRWQLEVEQPMVETLHHRANASALNDDFHPVDHYIWAIEPGRDGGIYVWIPASPEPALVYTGLTMKKLVEELAPHAPEDPPVAYLGEKKTAMMTLDAATGRVLKWFGTSGSQVNDAESCFRPNAIYGQDECSSAGTITLGRTEYTVGIQRRDGRPIATLKYNEWVLNTYDNDLLQQYNTPLDLWYITSQHDGSVYGFSHRNVGVPGVDDDPFPKPLLKNQFPTPVARVFDICRPRGSGTENNRDSELVILPQPPPPAYDASTAYERRNSVFLNRTVDGDWYALSGQSYPLITNAAPARIQHPDSWQLRQAIDTLTPDQFSRALVGTHHLDMVDTGQHRPPTLPPGQLPAPPVVDPDTGLPELIDEPAAPPTIGSRVNSFKEMAARRLMAWVMNEVWIPIFVILIIVYQKELRRQCRRLTSKRYWVESSWLGKRFATEADSDSEAEEKVSEAPSGQSPSEEPSPREPAEAPAKASPEPSSERPSTDVAETGDVEAQGQPVAEQPEQPEKPSQVAPLADRESESPPAEDKTPQTNGQAQVQANGEQVNGAPAEKKKKAHRGRRGGVKHRKKDKERDASSQGRNQDPISAVEDAVDKAIRLREPAGLEPDVRTMPDDMQSVAGPIIRMGNIEVDMDDQLGTGSNGTLVFAGKFDGRVVAVKRMLIQFYDIASQETKLLRESDDHPNVIRYFAQQVRDGFLYIALERCAASLADVVEKPHAYPELAQAGRIDLPGVLLQVTNGISHLHSLRIVHRDLKPQNILVNMGKDGRPRLLVSDFGLCKKLEGGQSSFGATTGRAAGTSGWRAPELLLDDDASTVDSVHSGSGSVLVNDGMMTHRRATRSIDIFSLGLVFFYVLTNGSHPFDCGDRYMREVNIRKDIYSLDALNALGDFAEEAKDLVASMLSADAKMRPSAREVMSHPFFWTPKVRLQFLCDVSDHFEKEPRDPPSAALEELELHAPEVTRGDFQRSLPREFLDSLGRQRKYTGSRLLDLLRALRNKRNHYEDMHEGLRRTVGPLPEGYLAFWTVRFPSLLLVCWNVVYTVGWDSADRFREYYEPVRT